MGNVFKAPEHRAQIGYNGFDMSQYRKFTSSVGQLLPVYYDLLNPGDKINSRSFIFSRTETLSKAAMVSLDEHLDWFFVPMEQLYHALLSVSVREKIKERELILSPGLRRS